MGACKDTFIKIRREVRSFLNIEKVSYESCLLICDNVYVSAPKAPSGLVVISAENNQIELNWDDLATSPDSYTVYVEEISSGNIVQTITGLTSSDHIVTGVNNDVQYELWVTAIASGIESEESNHVTATPTDTNPPTAPTGLTVIDERDTEIDISWDANTEPDLAGYNIYTKISTDPSYTKDNTSLVSIINYTIDSLSTGVIYDIKITAVDQDGNESADSVVVQGETSSQNTHSLSFDGDDEVEIPSSADYDLQDFTIEAWIKTPDAGTGRRRIFSRQVQPGGIYYILGLNGNVLEAGSSKDSILTTAGPALNDNTWHHVAIVRDTVNDIFRWIVDGVQVNSVAISDNTAYSNIDRPATIGYWYGPDPGGSPGEFYSGLIDQVRIWNIARTPADISNDMGTQLDGDEAGLIGLYTFNEGSGTTAIDSTSSNNDGTISGATYSSDVPFPVSSVPDVPGPFNLSVVEDSGELTGQVDPYPVAVDSYNWYLDGVLQATTPDGDPDHVFTGLSNGQEYLVGSSVTVGGVESPVTDYLSHRYDTGGLGSTGTLIQDPSAIFYAGANNRSYYTWQDNQDPIGTYVFYYDHDTDEISNSFLIGRGNTGDGHLKASIDRDSAGYFYAPIEATHNGDLKIFKSDNPEDITSWTQIATIPGVFAYPQIFIDDTDTLFILSRYNHHRITCTISNDSGASWTNHVVFDNQDPGSGGDKRFYNIILPARKNQGIHLAVRPRDNSAPSAVRSWPDAYYMHSDDGINWENIEYHDSGGVSGFSKDINANPAITPAELDTNYSIVIGADDDELNFIECGAVTPSNEPIVCMLRGDVKNTPEIDRWELVRWNGVAWEFSDISSSITLTDFPDTVASQDEAAVGAIQAVDSDTVYFWTYDDKGSGVRDIYKYYTANFGQTNKLVKYVANGDSFDLTNRRFKIVFNYFDLPGDPIVYWQYNNGGGVYSDLRSSIPVPANATPSGGAQPPLLEETFIDSNDPGTVKGAADRVAVRRDSFATRRPYIKFDISGLSGSVTSATLRLIHNNSGAAHTIETRPSNPRNYSWDENTLTWNNNTAGVQSAEDPAVTFDGSEAAGDVATFDVTNYVNQQIGAGASFITIILHPPSQMGDTMQFASKEHATYDPPQLIIT